jgi:uncharacterized protein
MENNIDALMTHSILWRGIYLRGHEACRLYQVGSEWCLEGTAVFAGNDRPCRLSYLVACDSDWNTLRAAVSGWVGNDNVNIQLSVDTMRHWQLNGINKPAVNGCVDLDLNFSPSTNLLPIRRLKLEVGQQAEVNAAWLRFPSFELEPLSQVYTRIDTSTYRYSSRGGEFVRDLTIDQVGFVTNYPELWQIEQ